MDTITPSIEVDTRIENFDLTIEAAVQKIRSDLRARNMLRWGYWFTWCIPEYPNFLQTVSSLEIANPKIRRVIIFGRLQSALEHHNISLKHVLQEKPATTEGKL